MSPPLANEALSHRVSLKIPCLAEYVSIARLAILGIAGRMPLSYDEVEDVRLAVGEACTHAVERSAALWPKAPLEAQTTSCEINIECSITASSLAIDICDDVPIRGQQEEDSYHQEAQAPDEAGIDRQQLSSLLMEILVDEVHVNSGPNGTCVRLVKYASQA